MFAMERMHYVGTPVNISTANAAFDGSHRFYADAGHTGFDPTTTPALIDAINIAFGVLPENQKGDVRLCPDGLTQTCGLALEAKGTCATGVVTCVGNRWGDWSIQPAK